MSETLIRSRRALGVCVDASSLGLHGHHDTQHSTEAGVAHPLSVSRLLLLGQG